MSKEEAGHQPVAPERFREAYEVLVRPCIDSLYRTALRMTGDRHAADDLVQETCLRAYRGFAGFNHGTNFKAWLFRILTNASIDSRRRSSRAVFVELGDDRLESGSLAGSVGQPAAPVGPEVHVLHKTFRSAAFQAMAGLPPDIRVVVALALLEDFSYQEISEIVGCPVGTVRSRLSRGRQRLQEALQEYVPCGPVSARALVGGPPSRGGKA